MKKTAFLLGLCCATHFAYAGPIASSNIRPFVSLGILVAAPSAFSTATSFPIVDPVVDSFYDYSDSNDPADPLGGLNFTLGIEWLLHPMISIQGGVDYVITAPMTINGTLAQGADIASENIYEYHYQILSQQVLALGKFLLNVGPYYHPYLLVGLGASFNTAEDFDINVNPCLALTREYENNTQTNFSYAVGAGIDFDLLHSLRAGIGYRYTGLGNAQFEPGTIGETQMGGTLTSGDINFNEVLFQLSWIF